MKQFFYKPIIIEVLSLLLSMILGIYVFFLLNSYPSYTVDGHFNLCIEMGLGIACFSACFAFCHNAHKLFIVFSPKVAFIIFIATILISICISDVCPIIPNIGTATMIFWANQWTIMGDISRVCALLFWLCWFTGIFYLLGILRKSKLKH